MWCSSVPSCSNSSHVLVLCNAQSTIWHTVVNNMAEHRVSTIQLGELLDFLEANPAVAKDVGLGSRSKENIDREWENIAAKLNAHGGGCSKTGLLWKRYWFDLKHKVKSRAAESRREAGGTGGPSTLDDLSEVDKKVLAIIGDAAVFSDIEHQVPASPTHTSTPATRVVNEDEIMDFDANFSLTGIETHEPWVPGVNSLYVDLAKRLVDATGDRRASSYLAQRISIAIQRGRGQVQQHIVLPHKTSPSSRGNTNRSSDRESPHSLSRRIPRRPRTILPQASNVPAEWVIDLERRVAVEEKKAEAALAIAHAIKTFVELSRMHMEAMHKILDLIKNK